jgi:hypothetical protein
VEQLKLAGALNGGGMEHTVENDNGPQPTQH